MKSIELNTVTIIIHYRYSGANHRIDNLFCILYFLRKTYGTSLDILLVEQDAVSRTDIHLLNSIVPLRHEFLYNPFRYNRGWGKNCAAVHFTDRPVVVFLDIDMIPSIEMVESINQCLSGYYVSSPYKFVYYTNSDERKAIISNNGTLPLLNRNDGIKTPVTITGGIVTFDRNEFIKIGGFQQFLGYGAEDRALDVKVLTLFPKEKISILPRTFYHLYHSTSEYHQDESEKIANILEHDYGCKYDPSIQPDGYIHSTCIHSNKEKLLEVISKSQKLFANLSLYKKYDKNRIKLNCELFDEDQLLTNKISAKVANTDIEWSITKISDIAYNRKVTLDDDLNAILKQIRERKYLYKASLYFSKTLALAESKIILLISQP